jgi:hypothetical protein
MRKQGARKEIEQAKIRRLDVVAHACNPSFSGSKDQEDHCSRPAPAKN